MRVAHRFRIPRAGKQRASKSIAQTFVSRFRSFNERLPFLWASIISIGGVVFAVLMVGLCALTLVQAREDTLAHATQTLDDVSLIAQRDIERNFEFYALSLQGVLEGLNNPDVTALPPALRKQVLFDRAASANYLGDILVLDAHGKVTISSRTDLRSAASFNDRTYFEVQRDNPNAGLYVSDPFASRIDHGDPMMAFSRRIDAPDGSFAGVVMVGIRVAYFRDLFAGLSLGGGQSAVALLNTSGKLLMRRPERAEAIGRDFSSSPVFRKISQGTAGHFIETTQLDGVKRLYSYRRISGTPLIVIVASAEASVLAKWQRRSAVIGAVMLLSAATFGALSFLLGTQLRARMQAEAGLRKLARTDGLTGLLNRRTLNDVLTTEWRRSRRTRQPFSVLFVDIDYFKIFNDTYGHQAGDKTLVSVAHCIRDRMREGLDSIARYGGEEFVVLMPGTTALAAQLMASQLLASVRELKIEHAASHLGNVTVSIGSATLLWNQNAEGLPHANYESVAALLKGADDAVYQAKTAGRNIAVSANAGSARPHAAPPVGARASQSH